MTNSGKFQTSNAIAFIYQWQNIEEFNFLGRKESILNFVQTSILDQGNQQAFRFEAQMEQGLTTITNMVSPDLPTSEGLLMQPHGYGSFNHPNLNIIEIG